jgi:hypothetical protein
VKHHQQRAAPVGDLRRRLHVIDHAEKVGRLNDYRGGLVVDPALQILQVDRARVFHVAELFDRHSLVQRVGAEHFAILRVHAPRGQRAVPAGDARRHHGRFRHRGRAVVHRSVGHVHAGELADHGLKFKDGGKCALRDFGLVGRVGSQKLTARNHRIHQHRAVMAVDTGAEERCISIRVFGGPRAEIVDDFVFGDPRRQVQRPAQPHRLRQVGKQVFGRRHPASVQHLAAFGI